MKINYSSNFIYKPNFKQNYHSFENGKQNCGQENGQHNCENQKYKDPIDIAQKQLADINSYYIRMQNYSRNYRWAEKMLEADEKITNAIKSGADFETVELLAQKGVQEAYNLDDRFKARKIHPKTYTSPYCVEKEGRGSEYFDTYAQKTSDRGENWKPSSSEEYKDANVSSFKFLAEDVIKVEEGWNPRKSNLELAKREYEKLRSIENPTEEEINKSIATIHWLIAQESPYEKGSDSIANLITKSIYHAYNMETSPIKPGHSFDFEAWYQDLGDFVENYQDLFETRPHVVE